MVHLQATTLFTFTRRADLIDELGAKFCTHHEIIANDHKTLIKTETRICTSLEWDIYLLFFLSKVAVYGYYCVSCCRSVCLSGRISWKRHGRTSPNFMCVLTAAAARSPFCDTLCTSGFVDNIIFSHLLTSLSHCLFAPSLFHSYGTLCVFLSGESIT